MIGYPLDSHVEFDTDGTPKYDRAISSAPLRKLYNQLFSDGVMPNPSTNLQVSAGEGMNVIVQPGFALCNGCLKLEEMQRTLAVQASDALYDRIDTVVLRLNDNDDARICDLYIVKGVPTTSPVRPTLQRTESIFELGLADLFIAKNSTAVSNQRITDTRYETERCGIISSISQFDTTTLYQQIQADLAGFKENEQAQFIEWFTHIKTELDGDVAGNLQNQIDELKVGDTQNNTVSFECLDALDSEDAPLEWTDVDLLESGQGHKTIFGKISAMFKNVRYLKKRTDEIKSNLTDLKPSQGTGYVYIADTISTMMPYPNCESKTITLTKVKRGSDGEEIGVARFNVGRRATGFFIYCNDETAINACNNKMIYIEFTAL